MPGPSFLVDTETRTGIVLVTVRGDLDMDSADELVHRAAEAVERGDHGATLVIDVSDVTFADSTGLTALVRCAGLTPGHRPVLLGASDVVHAPLRSTGLDALFELQATYEITAPHVFDLRLPPPTE